MPTASAIAKRFFIFVIFIKFILLLNSCNEPDPVDRVKRRAWFKEYFLKASHEQDNSQRIFCLWFAGDRQAYTKKIYIGGKEKESARWFAGVEDLLIGLKEADVPELKFTFEIVVDETSENSEQQPLKSLLARFPDRFKVTPLKSLPPQYLPPKDILEHALVGNPAFASDALRIWYLRDPDYATNVYIDVDTFIDKVSHFERYSNYKIFGREVDKGFLYFSFNNNEYLIDKGAPEVKIKNLKENGLKRYEQYKVLISHYKNRARFTAFSDPLYAFDKYQKVLKALVDDQMSHPNNVIDMVPAIILSFGPVLWVNSSTLSDPDTKENKGINDPQISAQAWKGGNQIPVGTRVVVNKLKELHIFDPIRKLNRPDLETKLTKIVLNLNYLGWDYSYFSHFENKELSELLAKEIDQQWKEAKKMLARFPIEGIKDELSKTSGGLYLAMELTH